MGNDECINELEGNNINADINKMRLKTTESSRENDSIITGLVAAVEALLSTKNLKQKSRKSIIQIWVSSEIRAVNKSSFELFGVLNKVTENFNNNIEEEMISLNGLGRLEAIEMVRSMEERATDENKIKVANRNFTIGGNR